jgi:hypothetical protein
MINQPGNPFTLREWMRALGLSALCGVAGVGMWIFVVLASRAGSQAISGATRQSVWLLPAVIAIFWPVMLFTGRRGSRPSGSDRG